MSESTLFLHIGMPKAASSYLHGSVFPLLMPERYLMPGAANAKKPGYRFRRNAFSVRRFSDSFHQRSDFWHQHGDEFIRKFLSPFLTEDREQGSVLVSDEAVTRLNHFNIPRMPGAFDRDEIENNFRSFAQAAYRVGFASTRVLLILRRQDFLLTASYAQLSRKIVGASQADFAKRTRKLIKHNSDADRTDFYSLDYFALYQCLARVLTDKNIMMLPLEEFSSDFSKVIRKLKDFFALEDCPHSFSQLAENSRSEGDNKWGLRPLLLFKSTQGKFEITAPRFLTGRGKHVALTPELSSAIMSSYKESNRKLDSLLDIGLDEFGYYA